MKKKIGIINFQYSDHNYGAVLQAVALEKVISDIGVDVEHINYIPRHRKNVSLKRLIVMLIEFLRLKRWLLNLLKKKVAINDKVYGSEVFENFRASYLNRTKIYRSSLELKEANFDYDIVVVGSDQVWRPRMYMDPTEVDIYFLSFVPAKSKRVSYAASFGVDDWEYDKSDAVTHLIYDYLHRFNAISVRENSGVDICKNIFNINAKHVLDPTLLIGRDFFEDVIGTSPKNDLNKVSYYKLDLNEKFIFGINQIAHKSNFQPQNIYYKKKNNRYEYYPVSDWLKMIRDSALVITDSFHCVCFSILYNKNFYCCINEGRGKSRLESLLGDLGLKDRLINEDDLVNINIANNIDYDKVENVLQDLRKTSLNYLLNAISEN